MNQSICLYIYTAKWGTVSGRAEPAAATSKLTLQDFLHTAYEYDNILVYALLLPAKVAIHDLLSRVYECDILGRQGVSIVRDAYVVNMYGMCLTLYMYSMCSHTEALAGVSAGVSAEVSAPVN